MKNRKASRIPRKPNLTGQPSKGQKVNSQNMGVKKRWQLSLIVIAAIVMVVFLIKIWKPTARKADLLSQASRALRTGDFELAEKLSLQHTSTEPNAATAWWIAAQAAAGQARPTEVREYCQKMLDGELAFTPETYRQAGELAFRSHSIHLSQRFYALAIERDSTDLEARQRYLYLLGLSGRLWEAVPLLHWFIDTPQTVDYQILLLLGDYHRVTDFSKILDPLLQNNPSDGQTLLGLARAAQTNLKPRECLDYLRRAERVGLQGIEYQACLGQTLFEIQDMPALVQWRASLNAASYGHPVVWRVLGQIAKQFGQSELARECFTQAVALDPNDMESVFLLADSSQDAGDSETASELIKRHGLLEQLMRKVLVMYKAEPRGAVMQECAGLCEQLGRMKEAVSWHMLITRGVGQPSTSELKTATNKIQELVGQQTPNAIAWQVAIPQIRLKDDQSTKQLVGRLKELDSALLAAQPNVKNDSPTNIVWNDVAQQSGLKFNYFSSPTAGAEGKRIFEFGGGGVGVLDYDRDGWPDLLFTQGCQWPPGKQPVNSEYHQTLFRNSQGQQWHEISDSAGVDAVAFGQGLACGDFDNDGFSDIYVGCIGKNILLRNNGDGTFSDVTEALGLASATNWTTSVALADVTGDGLPDIYDVNYLSGEDLFERVCSWEGGRKRICGPGTYPADTDRLWHNQGEKFLDVSNLAGIQTPDGKGLGVVIGNLDGSGRNSMFIANDQTANFFFVPAQQPLSDQTPWFTEEAIARGLAFDEMGAKQGCMGVAVGDFNRDNLIDLFVTNYVTESNTLYQQIADGEYSDQTRAANLREASIPMVGFGTQSVDARLDGTLDLIVTNGHLDDFSFKSQLYEMPTQYFRNQGKGIFQEVGSSLGGYFAGNYRGRGMARLDWNADGLDDIAISHLDSPAVLLQNQTEKVGQFLAIELVGTKSSRDCVGATVSVEVAGRKQVQLVTAGDGYQASNQKRLVFGLGDSESADRIEIQWPSGSSVTYESLAKGSWIAIEHQGIYRN